MNTNIFLAINRRVLAGMEIELSHLLGKRVDLRTAQDLSLYFQDEVLTEAKDAYAEK
jgi:uncharacterized protein